MSVSVSVSVSVSESEYITDIDLINIAKSGSVSSLKELGLERELKESYIINSLIAISIQYQKYDIFQYLIDLKVPTLDETIFIDYRIRNISPETLTRFIYLTIKYYNGFDNFLRYLITVKKVPIPTVALSLCAKHGFLDLVKLLFENGLIISIKSVQIASNNGHFDIVYFLLSKISTDFSVVPRSIINNIFEKGPLYLVEFIIRNHKCLEKDSVRLLFENGRKDIIMSLIEKNLLPDIGSYAIRDAYENKHFDLVYFLLKQRFPVDITSDYIVSCSNLLKKEGIIVNNVPYY